MTDFVVTGPAGPLRGVVRVPGDKSIAHRSLLVAALADGESEVRALPDGDDVARSASAVQRIGARLVDQGPARHPGTRGVVRISGGRSCLHAPDGALDMGNSGTAMRLMCGLVAPWPWSVTLTGDASLRRRPMRRIARPLRMMGAHVDCQGDGCTAPLQIDGGDLDGIDYAPPEASAQVKGAVLLAGLGAEGETVVRERYPTRTHTEDLLAACGARVTVDVDDEGRRCVRVSASELDPLSIEIPSDPSHGAFWIVAACTVPGSNVTVQNLYVGPARAGFLDVLRRMGADVTVEEKPGTEPIADVTAAYAPLQATDVDADEVPGLIDEIPILAVAAAHAEGVTRFSGLGELRAKESDRLATVVSMLASFGVDAVASVDVDGLSVTGHGGRYLGAGRVDAHLDHRIAMASAVAALYSDGPTTIGGWEAVATSYPTFAEDLAGLAR